LAGLPTYLDNIKTAGRVGLDLDHLLSRTAVTFVWPSTALSKVDNQRVVCSSSERGGAHVKGLAGSRLMGTKDAYAGNVAPLTAECYSESRLSNRKTAGRKVCVEPAAL